MQSFQQLLDSFFSFPAYVMLPLIIFVLALIVRMSLRDAFLVGLRLGVGFAGVFIAFDFFVSNIEPAVEAIRVVRGLDFPVLDVGWPPLAAITWGSMIGPLSIPFVILLNVVMVSLKWTRTVYIDLWNIWHFALVGALLQAVTGSLWLGMAATLLIAAYTFITADFSGAYVEREMGLRSVSISPLSVVGLIPYATAMDKIWDSIPGIRSLNYNPEKQDGKIGLIGEPMVLGLVVGLALAVAGGYSLRDTLELAIHIGAVMFLLPKAAGLIGEGFAPLGDHLKVVLARRFGEDHELYFAMDTGVVMSHKSVMAAGLILMPVALALAFIVPGNRVLPLGDLPNLISVMALIVLVGRGNVIRAVLTGIPLVAGYLWIAGALAPLYTTLSAGTAVNLGTTREITAFTDGGNPVRFWVFHLFQGNIWAILVILPVAGMVWYAARHSGAARREAHSVR